MDISATGRSVVVPALDQAKLVRQFHGARERLFFFDYDGTLTPIVKDPQAAILPDHVLHSIKRLAADPRNTVWIISGRDQAFLDEWISHSIPELGLSAEHGCFIRKPHSHEWENLSEADMAWQKEVMEIFQLYTERTQGSFIERKQVALTWHYRDVSPELGASQAEECWKSLKETVSKNWNIDIITGKANLEVRPNIVSKGYIVDRLVNDYMVESGKAPGLILCVGDDLTDEGLHITFRAVE